ncbi:tRNA(Ile)-lysidine synthase [Parabacteroides sp. PFB2-10]|uniref:tRNA lysidine(34) synthetase TilS n=1 Tax=Parabacteroides sp. PFB2-10 TaxID=1742405 RepID=UPI0024749CB4|nr:tRNA lysidine(34) synthetase TilS [Parabacteroides sp. PFB2-10]MDH6311993.1 tRNA(Ile)-lysidine synthase [Parabacteroides sp. PFB2-10]
MLQTVHTYIQSNRLLPEGGRVVVGLSGGADSVALLKILVCLGYRCFAVHCNFHLRGEESDRDEAFSRRLAETLQIPFSSIDFDTTHYAAEHALSIEMAARELRYRWFEEKRLEWEADCIAVAHHRDDSVETLLMNLMRGTGIRGMGGIRPKNGYVIRPLLCVSREEIVSWLDSEQQPYMTDHTNASDIYTRNFIRLRILPLMEQINPSVREAIARTADHLSSAETLYRKAIEEAKKKVLLEPGLLSIPSLMHCEEPETMLFELLSPYHFNRLQVCDIFSSLQKESGKLFFSSTHRLLKDRMTLLLTPLEEEKSPESFLIHSENDVAHLPIELSFRQIVYSSESVIGKDKNCAWFDADKIRFPLELRRWQKGDWFIPFGMQGKQKLSDYFINHKYSRFEKENAWLLCSGDNILWIVGERTDNRFRIEPSTKQALIVKKTT